MHERVISAVNLLLIICTMHMATLREMGQIWNMDGERLRKHIQHENGFISFFLAHNSTSSSADWYVYIDRSFLKAFAPLICLSFGAYISLIGWPFFPSITVIWRRISMVHCTVVKQRHSNIQIKRLEMLSFFSFHSILSFLSVDCAFVHMSILFQIHLFVFVFIKYLVESLIQCAQFGANEQHVVHWLEYKGKKNNKLPHIEMRILPISSSSEWLVKIINSIFDNPMSGYCFRGVQYASRITPMEISINRQTLFDGFCSKAQQFLIAIIGA